jgi:hypothetical protein
MRVEITSRVSTLDWRTWRMVAVTVGSVACGP